MEPWLLDEGADGARECALGVGGGGQQRPATPAPQKQSLLYSQTVSWPRWQNSKHVWQQPSFTNLQPSHLGASLDYKPMRDPVSCRF
jgi:hypothetical protein